MYVVKTAHLFFLLQNQILVLSVISEFYALRCLSFDEMDDLIDFQPDKELCGGRNISEEQRWQSYPALPIYNVSSLSCL